MKCKKAIRIVSVLCLPALGLACTGPGATPFDPVVMQRMDRDRAGENVTPTPTSPWSVPSSRVTKSNVLVAGG